MNGDDVRPRILFACTANAGRSVAARLLAEHYGGSRIEAFSAGSEPGASVHPEVAAVLAERGLDASHERPKSFDPTATYDVVVTMGCGDTCPVFPGKRYLDWDLPDPAGLDLAAVRAIRDEISGRVQELLAEMVPGLRDGRGWIGP